MFESAQRQLGADLTLLREVAARVARAIGPDTSGPAAAEALDELIGVARQVDLATVKAVGRVDETGIYTQDGSRSAVAYLRRAANETPGWASVRVKLGRALADSLPGTLAAWADDRIGLAQATIICGAVKDLEPGLAAEIEQILSDTAADLSTGDLSGLAELIVAQAAPDDAAARDQQNYDRQHLSLSKTLNGQWKLDGRFDAEAGAIIRQVLDAFTVKPDSILGPDGVSLDTTTPGFRRAQAFTEMCRQAAEHSDTCQTGGAKATVVITIDHDDLVHGTGMGDVEGGSVLPGAAIRRLACDAAVIASSLSAGGTKLNFGRQTRIVASGLKNHLVSRDGGCVFPGCDARPVWCQVHHLIHWSRAGRTDRCNLILLCHFHHHLLHEGGWTTTGTADTLLFHPPDSHLPGGAPPRPAERHSIRRKTEHLLRC
jgi:hypothetical protein